MKEKKSGGRILKEMQETMRGLHKAGLVSKERLEDFEKVLQRSTKSYTKKSCS